MPVSATAIAEKSVVRIMVSSLVVIRFAGRPAGSADFAPIGYLLC
jgi:hypothetical protein